MSELLRDGNRVTVAGGQSNSSSTTVLPLLIDSITGRVLTSSTGPASGTFIYNEAVAGSGTSFTLAHSPLSGMYAIYGNGQRLVPGVGNDFTITGTFITTVNSYSTGTLLADYQY